MNLLHNNVVLVLNKNWQAINITTPANALSMMYAKTATGLDIKSDENMNPCSWNEWIQLPITDKDHFVATLKGKIKMPKVIILANFKRIPLRKPKFTVKNLWERDKGICQYSGKKLGPNEGNVDHVIPKSRGGKTSWTNCVLCHRDINSEKGNRTPSEAGLKLISIPRDPPVLPSTIYIRNKHNIKEWLPFLV